MSLKKYITMKKWGELQPTDKKEYIDIAYNTIGEDALWCDGDWGIGWDYGTMSESEFSIVVEDTEYVEQKAKELYNFIMQKMDKLIKEKLLHAFDD